MRKRSEVVVDESTEAGRIVRVKDCTAELTNAGMGGIRDRCYGFQRRGKGLCVGKEDRRDEAGPFQAGCLGQSVDDVVNARPREGSWASFRSVLYVFRGTLHDEIAVCFGEAITVENEGVEELTAGEGHEQPTAEPPWSLLEVASVVEVVKEKFQRA